MILKTAKFITIYSFFLISITCLTGSELNSNNGSSKPNIIFIMTDDQGWRDTGYNDHPYLKTPHLDKMSQEGITFTRFYSAAAMCSPTRGSCYTGRNPYRYGITFAMKGMLEPTEIPLTSVVKKKGYTTGHFGKWHMGTLDKRKGQQKRWGEYKKNPKKYYCPPSSKDIDVSFVTESKVPTWNPYLDPKNSSKKYGNDFFDSEGKVITNSLKGDASKVVMDRAIPFIQNAVKNKKPFFAFIWFHSPHAPVIAGKDYRKMYSNRTKNEQHYYGTLTAMDEQIGRLRTELSKLGVSDDTMLWFCSDNGPSMQRESPKVGSTKGLSGSKLSIKEGGIRVPGILVWPSKIKPKVIDIPSVTSDYFPTILDILNIPLPSDRVYDGISLIPFITKRKNQREKPIGFLNKEGKESVWMGDRYKLFVNKSGTQLFDIKNDPAEQEDLSKKFPEIALRMNKELQDWKKEVMKELKKIRSQ